MLKVKPLGARRRASGTSYRYYRWNITGTVGGGNPNIAEVQLLLSSVDQIPTMTAATTSGVTMDASNEHATGQAWKAGDDDSSGTRWDANAAVTQWIRVDFGSAQEIDEYSVEANDIYISSIVPDDWNFQGSDNGTDWTTLDTQTGLTWSSGETKNFPESGWSP